MSEMPLTEIVKWGIGAIFGAAMLVVLLRVMMSQARTTERLVNDFQEANARILEHHEESDRAWREVVERNTETVGELYTYLKQRNGKKMEEGD
jgi:hypothetical protein